jgi:hypothetical protein
MIDAEETLCSELDLLSLCLEGLLFVDEKLTLEPVR